MNKDRLIESFISNVKISSESYNELEFATNVKGQLEKLGFDVHIDNAQKGSKGNCGNVIAKLAPTADKANPLLFSSHLDTVTPGNNIEPIIEGNIIKSKGETILGGDDKLGISAIIEGIKSIQENNIKHGGIEILFTVGEEVGMIGSKNADYSQFKSKLAFVLDSGGPVGGIITSAPSQVKICVKTKGIAAHAGLSPEKGKSAIMMMADIITKLNLLRIDEETTANIGTIKGGSATNIVATDCEMFMEIRSLKKEKLDKEVENVKAVIKEIEKKYDSKFEVEIEHYYPSYQISDDDDSVKFAVEAFKELNIKAYTASTGGGSDANIINSKGIKALNLNNGSKNVHTTSEEASIEDLCKIATFIETVIKKSAL